MRTLLLLMTFLASVLTSFAQYNRVNDIPYAQVDNAYAKERCKLDVYYPTCLPRYEAAHQAFMQTY